MKIQFRGEEIEVVYDTYGKYIAPTKENPAEYPDVNITEIYYKGVDIMEILGEVDIDLIYELLIDEIYD